MESWVLWLIAACLLGVGEMLTLGFFLAPFAAGALLAAVAALLGGGGSSSSSSSPPSSRCLSCGP